MRREEEVREDGRKAQMPLTGVTVSSTSSMDPALKSEPFYIHRGYSLSKLEILQNSFTSLVRGILSLLEHGTRGKSKPSVSQ